MPKPARAAMTILAGNSCPVHGKSRARFTHPPKLRPIARASASAGDAGGVYPSGCGSHNNGIRQAAMQWRNSIPRQVQAGFSLDRNFLSANPVDSTVTRRLPPCGAAAAYPTAWRELQESAHEREPHGQLPLCVRLPHSRHTQNNDDGQMRCPYRKHGKPRAVVARVWFAGEMARHSLPVYDAELSA